jgi:hypothetical protein
MRIKFLVFGSCSFAKIRGSILSLICAHQRKSAAKHFCENREAGFGFIRVIRGLLFSYLRKSV